MEIIKVLALTILQNASFTLVSRARNSGSLAYNAGASVLSNLIYILILSHIVTSLHDWRIVVTYVIGCTIGSVSMQWIAIKYLEKKKER